MSDFRNKFYSVVCIVLVGILLAWASFFTYANHFSKICFSFENDVYELDQSVFDRAEIEDGAYFYYFPLSLKHYEVNYLRINTNYNRNDNPNLTFVAYIPKAEWETALILKNIRLKDGINELRLPQTEGIKEQLVGEFFIEGADTQIIKEASFIESVEPVDKRSAGLFSVSTIIVYFTLCIGAIQVLKKRQTEKRSGCKTE